MDTAKTKKRGEIGPDLYSYLTKRIEKEKIYYLVR